MHRLACCYRHLPYKLLALIFLIPSLIFAQEREDPRIVKMGQRLDSLSRFIPGLMETSDVSFTNVPLPDFVRAVGKTHNINVYIDNSHPQIITNDFSKEAVKHIFLFLCKEFELEIEATGTILNFSKYEAPGKLKPLQIQYKNDLLSMTLKNDSIDRVIEQISRLTGDVLITAPKVKGQISGYIPPSKPADAIENIFLMNGYDGRKDEFGIYYIQPLQLDESGKPIPGRPMPPKRFRQNNIELVVHNGFVKVSAEETELDDLLKLILDKSEVEYFIYEQLEGKVTLKLEAAPLDEVLTYLFQATKYTYRKAGDTYLVGAKAQEGLNSTQIVKLKYRPSNQVLELIPPRLAADMEIVDYTELNQIIISGQTDKVAQLARFIDEIDRPIPMVKIEMIVVELDKTKFVSTGIKAGLRQSGDSVAVNKDVLPGVDYTLNGPEINDILSATGIPALGSIGRLSSNFYLQLKAQETRGNLNVRMTPVLSMLNGREATLTIGQTQYYLLDTQTSATGAVNSFNQFTQRFEKIEANITLTIKPYISDNDMVTLDILPDFTTPVGRFDSKLPPTISTRKFDSTIRVKNGETVILGGLSREETTENTAGIPFLSRIPVLKWFFSNREKSKQNSSLIIYITPVIYYN